MLILCCQSFTGKELLRVLFANKIKPVVLIAFTNHALDHMLTSILDAKITDKLVRLGSRSSDERISEYGIVKLERTANNSSLDRSVGREFAAKKKLQQEMQRVMESIQIPKVTGEKIEAYLTTYYPDHQSAFAVSPFWIDQLARQTWEKQDAEGLEEWQKVNGKGKKKATDRSSETTRTLYGFWKHGLDIEFIQPPQIPQIPVAVAANKKHQSLVAPDLETVQKGMAEHQKRLADFFTPLGYMNQFPEVPTGNRSKKELLSTDRVWSMSMAERLKLAAYWEDEMRSNAYHSLVDDYRKLREEYETACTRFNDVKDEVYLILSAVASERCSHYSHRIGVVS
jgi:hypothetical protein